MGVTLALVWILGTLDDPMMVDGKNRSVRNAGAVESKRRSAPLDANVCERERKGCDGVAKNDDAAAPETDGWHLAMMTSLPSIHPSIHAMESLCQ